MGMFVDVFREGEGMVVGALWSTESCTELCRVIRKQIAPREIFKGDVWAVSLSGLINVKRK